MTDPTPAAARAPRKARRIGIIGAGPGGMAAAIRFRAAGYDDIVIWEKADGVGGTWFHNRYPGLACDVPSHLYSFSFDLNPRWSRAYAPQPEILAYMSGIPDRHGLWPHIRLSTEVRDATWDHAAAHWTVSLASGETEDVDILVSAQGMFNLIKWPAIAGLDDFGGALFHSARWRDDVSLDGKRVAVIGTAASAVQMVPVIAGQVAQLDLYQRTPNWVLPKNDPIFDDAVLAARQADGALVARERSRLHDEMDDMCNWTQLQDDGPFVELCRQNLAIVEDPELRRRLTPDFNWGCTRPLFSNDFYAAFNRANVGLITGGATRITPQGIVDRDGMERDYDVIICATGYEVDRFLSAIPVRGSDGIDIADAWADGAQAYLGVVTAGFPNLFMSFGPNTNNCSLIAMAEMEAAYMVRCVEWMDANDAAWMDVKPEVQARYNDKLQADIGRVWVWQGGCHNYYATASGRIVTQYPLNMRSYRDSTAIVDPDAFEVGMHAMA
ncbi:flavin-containing monooxygenase [Sphingomonas profundi]|uniref:flavin-containing monooxygenase n=1 Tax=Alterirhizorhabdus profundi TaxID=2681549 RepID=UPI0012E831D6|nr:NAD(P)/FAD-dependent oxidoreductase [Sphingomonas profundi]